MRRFRPFQAFISDPLGGRALASALLVSALLTMAALAAGAVRVLPWLLDPEIPWRVIAPFARSLGAIALEAALLTGWPVGWALAAHGLVERGEARVLLTLGERPSKTVLRLVPQALLLSAVLAIASLVGGRDAVAPGRVVTQLVDQGRAACANATEPRTFTIPFAGATWLCSGASTPKPRLVGRAPESFSSVAFTADGARVSDDLRRVDLTDARLLLGTARVHAGQLTLRGLPPWARASVLPERLRAALLALAGVASSSVAAYVTLRLRRRRGWGRFQAILLGATGPLCALAALRALERAAPDEASGNALAVFLLIPVAAFLGATAVALLLSRLPWERPAASQ